MGVDYYTCFNCGYNFPDCGNFETCYNYETDEEGCGKNYCSDECGEVIQPKTDDEKVSCISCRGELANDYNLLQFMLKRSNWSRAKAVTEYLKLAKKKE